MNTQRSSFTRLLIFGIISLLIICVSIPFVGPLIFSLVIYFKTITTWQVSDLLAMTSLILPIIFGFVAVIYLISILASTFPEVTLTDTGVLYRSILNHGIIKWDEVVGVTTSKGLFRIKLIVIHRKDSSLLKPKGLFYNRIQGIQFGVYEPVIALWGNVEEFAKMVMEKKKGL